MELRHGLLRGALPEKAPGGLVIRTGERDELPELRRVIHSLQMHQLVNHDVVADPIRHPDEPPVETDVPVR